MISTHNTDISLPWFSPEGRRHGLKVCTAREGGMLKPLVREREKERERARESETERETSVWHQAIQAHSYIGHKECGIITPEFIARCVSLGVVKTF